MGRCVYFLLLPPSSAMQQLFTLHDYWTGHNGSASPPIRRRSVGQQQQLRNDPLAATHSQRQLVCVSDTTGKALRRKPLPALPEAADLWMARIASEPQGNDNELSPAAVIGVAVWPSALSVRRCMSLESMPSFRIQDFN